MSREMIKDDIKEALKSKEYRKQKQDQASLHVKSDGELIQNCIENLKLNKNTIIECRQEQLQSKIAEILQEMKSKKLIYPENLEVDCEHFEGVETLLYDKSVEEMRDVLFECDTSIIHASYAISNTGVFCILASKEQPRLLSLLPQNCIILLKKEDIVSTISEAFENLNKEAMPTNIIFLAGPSRTADIELQVVLGVHGPRSVYGVIY